MIEKQTLLEAILWLYDFIHHLNFKKLFNFFVTGNFNYKDGRWNVQNLIDDGCAFLKFRVFSKPPIILIKFQVF
jgi:hypothetical protein